MDKEILFRFFEGNSSADEDLIIQEWMDASDENHNAFMRERLRYDTILMANVSDGEFYKVTGAVPLRKWLGAVAAAVAIVLLSGLAYLWASREMIINYTTLKVPAGQRVNLILQDSTEVWLNANTTFRYPSSFGSDKREVHLDGEGYFEVSKNKNNPFIVKTELGDIRVTGTKFNVLAYSDLKNFETSLFEGGVDVFKKDKKLLSLKPNQKVVLNDDGMRVLPIEGTEVYLWRNGLIAFKNRKLEEILPTFEKSFNVEIKVLNRNLPEVTYTGKFRQSEGVDYALRILQRSVQFSYYRDDETGTIYIK